MVLQDSGTAAGRTAATTAGRTAAAAAAAAAPTGGTRKRPQHSRSPRTARDPVLDPLIRNLSDVKRSRLIYFILIRKLIVGLKLTCDYLIRYCTIEESGATERCVRLAPAAGAESQVRSPRARPGLVS